MLYTIKNEFLTACICDTGAELHSLRQNAAGFEYIWQGDPSVWSGHAPLLFPVVGRLKDECFTHNGQTYLLGKHGFARKSVFEVIPETESRLTMQLKSGAHKESYPFDFTLSVTFELLGTSLKITHRVTNEGTSDMYFSLGAHPAFNCAVGDYIEFPEDETACAYRLRSDCGLLTDEKITQGITGHRLAVTESTFLQDALIFEGLRSDEVTLYCGGAPRVTVNFGNAPCLGIWAKPGAPYVCIEPWYGMDDSASVSGVLSEKPQIVRLAPSSTFRFPLTVQCMIS